MMQKHNIRDVDGVDRFLKDWQDQLEDLQSAATRLLDQGHIEEHGVAALDLQL